MGVNLFHMNREVNQEVERLVEKFIDASIKYGESIELGESKMANKQSSIIRKVRKQLVESCKLDLLIPSLKHNNDYVKLNAASSLIGILPDDARDVLGELQGRKGLVGFEAKMFLQEWYRGNIKI